MKYLNAKKSLFGGIGILWLALSACTHRQGPSALRVADSLYALCPDRALVWLDSLRPLVEREGKDARMRFALLRFKACDRDFLSLPPEASDDLARALVRHFEGGDDMRPLVEAYYYAGRVAHRQGNATQALDYFVQALTRLPAGGEVALRGRVASRMGSLYLSHGLFRDALEMLQEGLRCDSTAGDSIGWAYVLQDLGECHHRLGDYDRELSCYLQACRLGELLHRKDLVRSLQSRLAAAYTFRGQYDLAGIYLQQSLPDSVRPGQNAVYMREVVGFRDPGGKDSIVWKYKNLLQWADSTSYGVLYDKLRGMGEKLQPELDRFGLYKHMDNYETVADSLLRVMQPRMARQEELAAYRSPEKENILLREANLRGRRLFFRILAVAACLFAGAVLYHLYRRRQLVAQLRMASQLNEDIYKRSEDYIEANNLRICQLEEQIRLLNKQLEDTDGMRRRLEQEKVLVTYANCEAEALQGKRSVIDSLFLGSEVCLRFKRLLDEDTLPQAVDWADLQQEVDTCYEGFTRNLGKLCSVKARDLRICLLAKMGWGDTDIARLVSLSPEGVASACRRLHAKSFPGEERHSSAAWHKFIGSL